jgi:hypothetical protein
MNSNTLAVNRTRVLKIVARVACIGLCAISTGITKLWKPKQTHLIAQVHSRAYTTCSSAQSCLHNVPKCTVVLTQRAQVHSRAYTTCPSAQSCLHNVLKCTVVLTQRAQVHSRAYTTCSSAQSCLHNVLRNNKTKPSAEA